MEWLCNGSEIRTLLDNVLSHFKLNEKGQVSWTSGWEIYAYTLFKKFGNKPEFDEKSLFELFCKAIRKAYQNDPKIKVVDSPLTVLQELLANELGKNDRYTLVTTISIKKSVPLKSKIINGVRISFYNSVPKKYKSTRFNQLSDYINSDYEEPEGYKVVTLSCRACGDHKTTAKKMMDSLDLYRGLLELCFKNPHNFLADKEEVQYPTSSGITLGEYHTLHKATGETASDLFWYQKNFSTPRKPLSLKDVAKTEDVLKKHMSWLKRSKQKYRNHVEKAILLYVRAIDLKDTESRFLKLWTAIEVLLANCDNESALSGRISFRYKDRNTVKMILRELRRDRNDAIHKGRDIVGLEYKAFILKDFAEDIFRFFIKNPYNFSAPLHVVEFLNMPTDVKTIEEKIKRLKQVKKFIGVS